MVVLRSPMTTTREPSVTQPGLRVMHEWSASTWVSLTVIRSLDLTTAGARGL